MSEFTRLVEALRSEGPASALWRSGKWLSGRINPFAEKPLSGVFAADVVAADWTQKRTFAAEELVSSSGRPRVAWIISPPSKTSGGHQNAFRFMRYLEDAGYDLTIIFYSAHKYPKVTVKGLTELLEQSSGFPSLSAEYALYDPEKGVEGNFDLIVASDWATAYAAWRYERNIPRFYFVQDFEPYFYEMGSDYALAENSYRLGYHGLTVGPWLANKVARDYGMPADFTPFSVDSTRYSRTSDSRRNEVIFYARPNTARRATEFGLLVLDEVARRRPDITINIFGADMSHEQISFPYVNHGALDVSQLSPLFNKCAVGFSLSMTNVSLFPLEAMACGAVPILNDGENTRDALMNDPGIEFLPMSPALMAERIIQAVDRPDQVEHSRKIAASVEGSSWDASGKLVVDAVNKVMGRGK